MGTFAHHTQALAHLGKGHSGVPSLLMRLPVKRRCTQTAVQARSVQPFRNGAHALPLLGGQIGHVIDALKVGQPRNQRRIRRSVQLQRHHGIAAH